MADHRTWAEKLAAMAAQSASPHEAAIAAAKLGSERGSQTIATTPERKGRVVVVTIVDQSEDAPVDDYGPFAGVPA